MRPIAPDLFTDDASPRLIGGRSRADGAITFPLPAGADAELYEAVELKEQGVLWSWTVQRFPPKPPYLGAQPFKPYIVGYVALEGQVIVEARLVDIAVEDVRIGMALEITRIPFEMITGDVVSLYAFRPAGEA